MKKLKLESLDVTSFETSAVPRIRGTLRAHEDVGPETIFPCSTAVMDCTWGYTPTDDPVLCVIVMTEIDCETL